MRKLALVAIAVTVLAGCSPGRVATPDVVDTWQPPEGAESDTPYSCEEVGSLFAYDPQLPLDVREVQSRRGERITVTEVSYASPLGGRVPATLIVPDGQGPFAGLLVQHGMGEEGGHSVRQSMVPQGEEYARLGAVVILIDAPFARPQHSDAPSLLFTKRDRLEQIQHIVDLRRAVDLLLSRPDVDPQRLAYVGVSGGAAMGGLLAAAEDRLQGYALVVGDGGLVEHATGPEDIEWWLAKPEATRRQWVAWMWPIEPIHYVGCAAPAALLFQNGTLDKSVSTADAVRYQKAGSEPKTILWYEGTHSNLGVQADRDRIEWLRKTVGLAN